MTRLRPAIFLCVAALLCIPRLRAGASSASDARIAPTRFPLSRAVLLELELPDGWNLSWQRMPLVPTAISITLQPPAGIGDDDARVVIHASLATTKQIDASTMEERKDDLEHTAQPALARSAEKEIRAVELVGRHGEPIGYTCTLSDAANPFRCRSFASILVDKKIAIDASIWHQKDSPALQEAKRVLASAAIDLAALAAENDAPPRVLRFAPPGCAWHVVFNNNGYLDQPESSGGANRWSAVGVPGTGGWAMTIWYRELDGIADARQFRGRYFNKVADKRLENATDPDFSSGDRGSARVHFTLRAPGEKGQFERHFELFLIHQGVGVQIDLAKSDFDGDSDQLVAERLMQSIHIEPHLRETASGAN
jgi:hypothetical protein